MFVSLKLFVLLDCFTMDVDSKAVSAQSLLDLEFGWDTFGCFAFAVPSTGGGTTDDQQFKKDVICRLCESGEDDSPPQSAAIQRLWFEARCCSRRASPPSGQDG